MTRRTSLMSKVLVFMLAFAVVFTYSVMPMNQAYAASAKKPAQVKNLKAKAMSSSSIKLTWNKAKNAKKYQVYMATAKKGKYRRVATLKSSKRTFTKGKLKASKKYYFKVRAVNGKRYGKFSLIKYATTKKKSSVPAIPDRQVFVNADYVKALADSGRSNVVIAEVSWGPMDYAPDKMIKGAIHVNTDDLESNYQDLGYEFWDLRGFNNNYKELITALESYGITTDTELVCYGADPTGSAQTRLAMAALMMGVKKVRVLDGGVAAWGDKGYPMVDKADAAVPTPASFGRTTPLHPDWVISTPDMLKKVESDSNFKLVSIRSYDEFCGKTSGYAYIDIAGEPKGAIWGRDTDDGTYFVNGKTVDTDKIDEYLKPYGASTKNELAFYCGTGWRATIPFLICYEEGIDNMKLWDDGWYVYSGAYADDWNYGDGTAKGEDFNSHPVQIGDPAKGEATYTTVKALWDASEYYNPLRGLSAKKETMTARFAGSYISNFSIMPPKGNIEKSVKFSSSDESVAKVDEYGNVEVLDTSAEKDVTISAVSNATFGGQAKEASFTLKVTPATQIISAEELMKAIEDRELAGGSFKILDVRAKADYDTAHIISAVSADVSGAVADGGDQAAAKTNVSDAIAGDDGNMRYALICYSGNKYANAGKAILEELGVDPANIFILGQDDFEQGANGGMKGWNASFANFVVATEVSQSDSSIITNGISAENLEAVLGSDHAPFVVMDVRAADDYNNGHIAAADLATCPGSGPDDASRAAVKALVDEYGTDAIYVACCYTGKKCADCAYKILKELGVDDAHIIRLTGGMAAWKGDLTK